MKVFVSLLLLVSYLCFAGEGEAEKFELPKPDADGWISIFNGKDLTGWYNDAGVFTAENGEIVGKTDKGLKRNEFLKSKFEVTDFRLVLEMKLTPNKENSGIQVRSVPYKGHEMKGYQADAGAGWWGKLYEESGRGLLWKEDTGNKAVKPEDWNVYEIICVGTKIRTAINGVLCVDLDDPKGAPKGIFGLQMHSGGPMDVRWRNLKLQLNPKDMELTTAKK
ncbi:MAG TPA: DUF1080 domain-containing protein [Planctomycetota bacterium]|nr:DUF1080 domain-containing protein [Planctomycetota bacterium]